METISSSETKNNIGGDLKEIFIFTLFGGIGGFFSWLYTVAMGEQNQLVWWKIIPISISLGMLASFIGIYVIANSDTRSMKRSLGFALLCGLSWKPVIDAGKALIDKTVNQEIFNKEVKGELQKAESQIKEINKVDVTAPLDVFDLQRKLTLLTDSTVSSIRKAPFSSERVNSEVQEISSQSINAVAEIALKFPKNSELGKIACNKLKFIGVEALRNKNLDILNKAQGSLKLIGKNVESTEIRNKANEFERELSSRAQ